MKRKRQACQFCGENTLKQNQGYQRLEYNEKDQSHEIDPHWFTRPDLSFRLKRSSTRKYETGRSGHDFARLFIHFLWYIGGTMEDKITIIEGPPPVFEAVNDGWALGLNESSHLSVPALTRLRTFNGPALVERCYRAWHAKTPMHLHYRNDMGVEQVAPIFAARNVETPDGHVLLLWVYLDHEKVEYEFDAGDDESDENNPE